MYSKAELREFIQLLTVVCFDRMRIVRVRCFGATVDREIVREDSLGLTVRRRPAAHG
jgi:hypothetical protein